MACSRDTRHFLFINWVAWGSWNTLETRAGQAAKVNLIQKTKMLLTSSERCIKAAQKLIDVFLACSTIVSRTDGLLNKMILCQSHLLRHNNNYLWMHFLRAVFINLTAKSKQRIMKTTILKSNLKRKWNLKSSPIGHEIKMK